MLSPDAVFFYVPASQSCSHAGERKGEYEVRNVKERCPISVIHKIGVPGVTLNVVFSYFAFTPSHHSVTVWYWINKVVNPCFHPHSHALSRISVPVEALTGIFRPWKSLETHALSGAVNPFHAHSGVSFSVIPFWSDCCSEVKDIFQKTRLTLKKVSFTF